MFAKILFDYSCCLTLLPSANAFREPIGTTNLDTLSDCSNIELKYVVWVLNYVAATVVEPEASPLLRPHDAGVEQHKKYYDKGFHGFQQV